jgi:unsaturated chondroitin disaccharide hydrolase
LWQLAGLTADPQRGARYREAAFAILTKLSSPEFLALGDPSWEGILRHGVYHERRRLGVDESVMWGDYFYVEALDRVLESARDARP